MKTFRRTQKKNNRKSKKIRRKSNKMRRTSKKMRRTSYKPKSKKLKKRRGGGQEEERSSQNEEEEGYRNEFKEWFPSEEHWLRVKANREQYDEEVENNERKKFMLNRTGAYANMTNKPIERYGHQPEIDDISSVHHEKASAYGP